MGDVKVKNFLNAIMQETLEPIRTRRKEFEQDIPALDDVRRAMKINYFDDADLIAEQAKRFRGE